MNEILNYNMFTCLPGQNENQAFISFYEARLNFYRKRLTELNSLSENLIRNDKLTDTETEVLSSFGFISTKEHQYIHTLVINKLDSYMRWVQERKEEWLSASAYKWKDRIIGEVEKDYLDSNYVHFILNDKYRDHSQQRLSPELSWYGLLASELVSTSSDIMFDRQPVKFLRSVVNLLAPHTAIQTVFDCRQNGPREMFTAVLGSLSSELESISDCYQDFSNENLQNLDKFRSISNRAYKSIVQVYNELWQFLISPVVIDLHNLFTHIKVLRPIVMPCFKNEFWIRSPYATQVSVLMNNPKLLTGFVEQRYSVIENMLNAAVAYNPCISTPTR